MASDMVTPIWPGYVRRALSIFGGVLLIVSYVLYLGKIITPEILEWLVKLDLLVWQGIITWKLYDNWVAKLPNPIDMHSEASIVHKNNKKRGIIVVLMSPILAFAWLTQTGWLFLVAGLVILSMLFWFFLDIFRQEGRQRLAQEYPL